MRLVKAAKRIICGAAKQPGMKRKVQYIYYCALCRRHDVVPFRYDRLANDYINDYYAETGVENKDKKWFHQRGFCSWKTNWYGMTKTSINDYISDFDFYNKCNYVNNAFQSWFEHKLNTYYLLQPFKNMLPEHYYYVMNGSIYPLADSPKQTDIDFEDIIVLIESRIIAAKPCVGGHGKGFYKFEYKNGVYFANERMCSKEELLAIISQLNDYIYTEYCVPHRFYRELCGGGW